MRTFVKVEDALTVCKMLRRLWEHRDAIPTYQTADNREAVKARFFALLAKL